MESQPSYSTINFCKIHKSAFAIPFYFKVYFHLHTLFGADYWFIYLLHQHYVFTNLNFNTVVSLGFFTCCVFTFLFFCFSYLLCSQCVADIAKHKPSKTLLWLRVAKTELVKTSWWVIDFS